MYPEPSITDHNADWNVDYSDDENLVCSCSGCVLKRKREARAERLADELYYFGEGDSWMKKGDVAGESPSSIKANGQPAKALIISALVAIVPTALTHKNRSRIGLIKSWQTAVLRGEGLERINP